MGGRGSSGLSGRRKSFYKSAMRTISDEQIISEKRKHSGFNSKGQFVMSKFDANYKYKGFGSEQFRKETNKYRSFEGQHVSKDGKNAVINVSPSNVFPTKYGYGLIIDAEHTVFFKDWQVWGQNKTNKGMVINFNKDYYNVKKWGDHSDMFSNDSKDALDSFDKVVKLAKKQQKFYAEKGINFDF